MNRSMSLCFTLFVQASVSLMTAQANLPALQSSIAIGGSGGWDYLAVNPENHQLYVSHASQMHVLDPATGKVVANLTKTPGVHGAAFDTERSHAFITCGGDQTVQVLDTRTYKLQATIKTTGKKPDAVLFEPSTKRVFVMNNGGDNITVLDAVSLKVVGTIVLSGAPEFAQADGMGQVFVNLEDKNAVAVIDATTLKVIHEWSLAPHATPTGLALDVEGKRLFVGCRSKQLVVLDATTGRVLAALPIGSGVDACAFDPLTKRAYASCKDGTVTVFDATSKDCSLLGNLKTEPGSKTMVLDPTTHQIFVPAAGAAGTPGDPKGGFQILVYQ